MERAHGQLRAWLTDRLGGNNTDCLTHGRQVAGGQIDAGNIFDRHRADLRITNPNPLHAGIVD